jgi:FHA domain
MKIKLQITMPDGAVRSLELRKPEVGIGRNPASPVTFAGAEAKGVSWDHATIRVEGNKISVADAASSNGTLLNDAMMPPHVPVALKVKDCIQLGYTGPKIVLLAFDPGEERFTAQTLIAAYGARRDAKSSERSVSTSEPSAKATAPAAAKGRRPLWPFVGGGVAVILIAVAGIFAFGGKRDKGQPKVPEDDSSQQSATNSAETKADLSAKVGKIGQVAEPKPVPIPPSRHAGRVVKFENDPPGTLLQWPGEPFSWSPLTENGEVQFGQLLVALPGFRCRVQLQSGVRITALSNLPEFDAHAPVIETSWVHEIPEAGYDARVIFDRGRLHFANGKKAGPARIKLAVRNSEWEIVLKGPSSQVVVECWFNPLVAPKIDEPGLPKTEPTIGFFTDGAVELTRGDKSFALTDRQALFQVGNALELKGPRQIPQWPDWWNANLGQSKDEVVLDAVLAVKDWANALEKSDEALKTVLKKCADEKDENRKSMAYLSLGSFGELGAMGEKAIEAICDVLESTQQSDDTRRAALFAMQVWLARSSKHLPLLMYTVTVRKQRYSAVDADQILRLAIEAAEADRASPALYQGWIAALESPRPAIRFLAWERLKRALGEEKAAAIPNSYHPNKSPKDPDQAKAIAQWHQLIPPGWVPPKTATR